METPAAAPPGHGQLPPAVAHRIAEYIEARLGETVTLVELAAVAGMGVWSFGRRFRASFGTTPHRYIVDRRLERARQLLVQGRLPVTTIAFACGFADQSHMTRLMHARLGRTPAALRERAVC